MMFWQMEDDKKGKDVGLDKHVLSAAAYYKEKYGLYPNSCIVNPAVIKAYYPKHEDEPIVIDGIKVSSKRNVIVRCLHIGFVE